MKSVTIGMDLGDKKNPVCVLGKDGIAMNNSILDNTREGLRSFFSDYREERQ